ncbi:MAG TPA: FGGY-family carbohydrate kinase [Solirubrobacteraceae bacterium]|nr:FGGY-family carbohydrate kinase [Solirubrobacteraceae bacterium]
MSDEVWVGLDVGTQSARALAACADGAVVGRGVRPLRSRRDGDRHEQDPAQWWEAAALACREALDGAAPGRVRGVAVCGTSGTILLLDRAGAPASPVLMYDDARAAGQGADKLRWLLEQPAAREPGARLAHQPDVITGRLVGEPVATDESHALKSGYDLQSERWSADVECEQMPPVVRAGSLLGTVCDEAAAQTALPAGTPVIAGMTDGCAAQIAGGDLRDGAWSSVLGTTLVVKGVSAQLIRDPGGALYNHRSPDGGWLPGGASSCGAGVLTAQFPDRDLDELGDRAQEHEAGAPVAYPLVGRGERFPFRAPQARPFVLGEPAGDGEHFAALLQGVAFVERLCLDYATLLGARVDGALTATGGATASRYWCQLRADVLGRPLRLPEQVESAFGMAVLAAAATRDCACARAAGEMCRTRAVIDPRPDRSGRFDERYLRLVSELERRGWLAAKLAEHARANIWTDRRPGAPTRTNHFPESGAT